MWLLCAFGSAFFAGVTAILAKQGLKGLDSTVATALRTIVVALFSWLMVLVTGSYLPLSSIPARSLVFLTLSGLATGASWLFYFHALQLGDVSKVTPIDKSSTIMTMLLAAVFLGERLTVVRCADIVIIAVGTFLMIAPNRKKGKKKAPVKAERGWFFCALLSAVFASLTSILGKVGIQDVPSTLGTALRTMIVLLMAWVMVFVTGKQSGLKRLERSGILPLVLSGITTGASWLCYYHALQTGPASVVVPIDKLSILITVAFSHFVLHETVSRRSQIGLAFITIGTLALLM